MVNRFVLPEFGAVDPSVLTNPALSTRMPHLAHKNGEPYCIPIGANKNSIAGSVRPVVAALGDGGVRLALENGDPLEISVVNPFRLAEFVDLLDIQRAGIDMTRSFKTPAIGEVMIHGARTEDTPTSEHWSVLVSPSDKDIVFTDPQLLAVRATLINYVSRSLAKQA